MISFLLYFEGGIQLSNHDNQGLRGGMDLDLFLKSLSKFDLPLQAKKFLLEGRAILL